MDGDALPQETSSQLPATTEPASTFEPSAAKSDDSSGVKIPWSHWAAGVRKGYAEAVRVKLCLRRSQIAGNALFDPAELDAALADLKKPKEK